MDEFIDNFNEFRDYLNHTEFQHIKDGNYNGDVWALYKDIKDKFNELGLNEVF